MSVTQHTGDPVVRAHTVVSSLGLGTSSVRTVILLGTIALRDGLLCDGAMMRPCFVGLGQHDLRDGRTQQDTPKLQRRTLKYVHKPTLELFLHSCVPLPCLSCMVLPRVPESVFAFGFGPFCFCDSEGVCARNAR